MPRVASAFRPAWWLRNAHAQTLWPSFLRRKILPPLRRERLELDDGDFLDLAWSGPPGAPVVILLHGLEGSLHSHYAGGLMRAMNARGLRVCFMHFRNCSEQPNRLPTSYHSGRTDDPQRLLEHIAAREGTPPLGAVGVSLGGNVLLKWLGEQGAASPLRRAAAMSVPFSLADAADRLERGVSRLYQRHLIGHLQASYRRKFGGALRGPVDDVTRLTTFRTFDDRVTAALHGFAGVDDYYARSSSRAYIPAIRVPTLVLHALDDPFMFPHSVPRDNELPPGVHLELTPHGGHMGFIGGRFPGIAHYYAEHRIAAWMADSLP